MRSSRTPHGDAIPAAAGAAIDCLTDRSPTNVLWTRTNTAEAAPGVLLPITSSYYGRALEEGARLGFYDVGLLPACEAPYPDHPGQRLMGIFYGRFAANVTVVRRIMSGLPGINGDDVERDMLGSVRDGVTDEPYPWRMAAVLTKAPRTLPLARRLAIRNRGEVQRWWSANVDRNGIVGGRDPRQLLDESIDRYRYSVRLHGRTRLLFQVASGQLTALANRAGIPEASSALLSGTAGTDEAAVADDLWRLAAGQIGLQQFLCRHGYHAPGGGDLLTRSWREDPRPVERLLNAVREAEPQSERRARAAAERVRLTDAVLAALPARHRLAARRLLRLAPSAARMLELTKTSFLVAVDCGRAAVRALGHELADAGAFDDPADAFHLFAYELARPAGLDLSALVVERRELRRRALELELPETWVGQPKPYSKVAARAREARTVTGLGASPGLAEGRVRNVHDPSETDVEPGEILVCPTTDPSWLALMTVAAAVVIDIGATASHGAIVARELGVPCVIGTRTGTTDLHDGDLVRVDGSTGLVEVIERANPASTATPSPDN